jgi:hypothetical protein
MCATNIWGGGEGGGEYMGGGRENWFKQRFFFSFAGSVGQNLNSISEHKKWFKIQVRSWLLIFVTALGVSCIIKRRLIPVLVTHQEILCAL